MARKDRDIQLITPTEFCNARYEASKLTPYQWLRAFMSRSTILKMIAAGDLLAATEENESNISLGIDANYFIRDDDVSDEARIANGEEGIYGLSGEVFTLPLDASASMHHSNISEKEITIGIGRQVFTSPIDDMLNLHSPPDGRITSYAVATVNVEAPDNILEEHFKLWLKEERMRIEELRNLSKSKYKKKASKRVMKVTPAKMLNWHNARVLQYADIIQWNLLRDRKISDEEAELIIFPDEFVEEKTRRTTRPLYEKFCVREELMALLSSS